MEPHVKEKKHFVKENMSLPRDNILLSKLATLKQVRPPSGRTFVARYKRFNRATLGPTNVRIKITYRRTIGPRRQRLKYFRPRKLRKRIQRQQGTGVQDNVIRGSRQTLQQTLNLVV